MLSVCFRLIQPARGVGGGGLLSTFGQFNQRGGCAVCLLSADSTSEGGEEGVLLSAFSQFSQWWVRMYVNFYYKGGGGGGGGAMGTGCLR